MRTDILNILAGRRFRDLWFRYFDHVGSLGCSLGGHGRAAGARAGQLGPLLRGPGGGQPELFLRGPRAGSLGCARGPRAGSTFAILHALEETIAIQTF